MTQQLIKLLEAKQFCSGVIPELLTNCENLYLAVNGRENWWQNEIWGLLFFIIAISLILFFMFKEYRHKMLVDLHHHLWLKK